MILMLCCVCLVAVAQTNQQTSNLNPQPSNQVKAQPKTIKAADDDIPDSLVHSRWRIQRTAPLDNSDLDSSATDLKMPDNLKQQAEYDDSLNVYYIGTKIGDQYVNTPVLMTPQEYLRWSERRMRQMYFRT